MGIPPLPDPEWLQAGALAGALDSPCGGTLDFFDFFDFLAECFASKTSVASVPARERSVQGIHRCRVSPSTSLNHTYMILFGEVGIYTVSRNCASSGALLFAGDDVDARLLPKRSLTLLTALIRLGSKQVAMAPLPKAYQYGTLPRLHAVRLLELRVWVGVSIRVTHNPELLNRPGFAQPPPPQKKKEKALVTFL